MKRLLLLLLLACACQCGKEEYETCEYECSLLCERHEGDQFVECYDACLRDLMYAKPEDCSSYVIDR